MKSNDSVPHSVLVISSTEKGVSFVTEMLDKHEFSPVTIAASGSEGRRLLLSSNFDFIIINAPLSDEFGHELALQMAQKTVSGILLIVKNEVFDEVAHSVENFGVLTLSKPLPKQLFYQSMRLLIATKAKWNLFQKENQKLQGKIEELRIVNRAKLVLITYLKMNEATAHRYIEKQAMDMRITRKEVAESILKTYEN